MTKQLFVMSERSNSSLKCSSCFSFRNMWGNTTAEDVSSLPPHHTRFAFKYHTLFLRKILEYIKNSSISVRVNYYAMFRFPALDASSQNCEKSDDAITLPHPILLSFHHLLFSVLFWSFHFSRISHIDSNWLLNLQVVIGTSSGAH